MKKLKALYQSVLLGAVVYGATATAQTIDLSDGTGTVGQQATVDFIFTNGTGANQVAALDFEIVISDPAIIGLPNDQCSITQGAGLTAPFTISCATRNATTIAPFIGAQVGGGGLLPIPSGTLATLTFDCLAAGTATLTVQNDTLTNTTGGDVTGTLQNGSVTCSAVGDEGEIDVDPSSLTLNATTGGTATSTVTVSNTGTGTLGSINATITGDAFAIADNGCGATLAPAASCTITVQFNAPGTAGTSTGALTITSDDADEGEGVDVALTGVATPPGDGVTAIPTLSEWAMIIMISLLLLGGAVTLRRNGDL